MLRGRQRLHRGVSQGLHRVSSPQRARTGESEWQTRWLPSPHCLQPSLTAPPHDPSVFFFRLKRVPRGKFVCATCKNRRRQRLQVRTRCKITRCC